MSLGGPFGKSNRQPVPLVEARLKWGQAAERAVELDPDLAEAHTSLGQGLEWLGVGFSRRRTRIQTCARIESRLRNSTPPLRRLPRGVGTDQMKVCGNSSVRWSWIRRHFRSTRI
jgi:hypothetical protein